MARTGRCTQAGQASRHPPVTRRRRQVRRRLVLGTHTPNLEQGPLSSQSASSSYHTQQATWPGCNQQAATFTEKVLPPRKLQTYAAQLRLAAGLWTVQGQQGAVTPRGTGLSSSLNRRAKPGTERVSGSPRSQPIGDRAGTLNCRAAVAWQGGSGALGGWAAGRLPASCRAAR